MSVYDRRVPSAFRSSSRLPNIKYAAKAFVSVKDKCGTEEMVEDAAQVMPGSGSALFQRG